PGAPDPALHLVADQQDAVPVAQLPQRGQVARRRNHVAPFALNRLYEDRRDALGIDLLGEQLVLDDAHAAHRTRRLAPTVVAAIPVAVWDVVYLRQERGEPGAVDHLARGEAQTAVAAPVERGHEVEVAVPVHVLDHGPLAPRNHEGIFLGVRGGRPAILARDDLPRLRPGRGDHDPRIVPHASITVRLADG